MSILVCMYVCCACINNTFFAYVYATQAESSYLPYSITRIGIEQELLVLLWKCLEEIPRFMPFILKHCDITEILVLHIPHSVYLMNTLLSPPCVPYLVRCPYATSCWKAAKIPAKSG